ncbi:Lysozyme family protein [Pseudomonas delhiensis]|uniref:Lysozyme family protein n=1 Tax=Pseudomonas delhiensis TaxID=366289 RepID=A0A239MU80_9PSED|nr:hypothetical protein [Pseudomonas delhiensis]SDK32786.1 Lysozyme family protein [Pseudomonas delhiensis]SNT46215.1 Lysozyme family protein [Pseudomonas delhiensis]
MAKVLLTAALRGEYEQLFNSCQIRPARAAEVEALVERIEDNQPRYAEVGKALGIPWGFIGVVHCMESGLRFDRHLHNGDPLTARTVQVPAGRPKEGKPPFTWEESAEDALRLKRLGAGTDWSLAGTLYQLEAYNGFGYRLYHPHVLSPYLWSYCNHYQGGKYVQDGTWSDSAQSRQCGAAVLLRRMAERGLLEFVDQPKPSAARPLLVNYSMSLSEDAAEVRRVEELQTWLNSFPGVFVKIDGVPGKRTSEAWRLVTGGYLPGDPRARRRAAA